MKIHKFWTYTFESTDFGLYNVDLGDKELVVKPQVGEEGKKLVLIEENEGLPVATLSVDLEESKILEPGYFYAPMWQKDKKDLLDQLVEQGLLEIDSQKREAKTPNGVAKVYRILNF
jgi:hypothetical protein